LPTCPVSEDGGNVSEEVVDGGCVSGDAGSEVSEDAGGEVLEDVVADCKELFELTGSGATFELAAGGEPFGLADDGALVEPADEELDG